ncbi:MAG: MFS transporter, partial [Dermatophilaceae bacterium]
TLPRRARLLLGLIFLTRLPFGFLLLQTLLLFRGPFAGSSGPTGGMLRFGMAAVAAAVGFTLAAVITPWLAPHWGSIPYAAHALTLAGATMLVVGPWLTPWSIVAVGFVVAFASQAVKINVDSLLQAHVPDELLGRTFAAYDVVYNAGLVVAIALAAVTLPDSGQAAWPFIVLAGGYAVVVLALGPRWQRAYRLDVAAPLG